MVIATEILRDERIINVFLLVIQLDGSVMTKFFLDCPDEQVLKEQRTEDKHLSNPKPGHFTGAGSKRPQERLGSVGQD